MANNKEKGEPDYISQSILGKLYRETEKYTYLQEFLTKDYEISVLRKYNLHSSILDLAPNKNLLH